MRIAITGKGGSGKTTIAGVLARVIARQGRRVLAIDGDPNANLAVTLGVPRETHSEIRPLPRGLLVESVDAGGNRQWVLGQRPEAVAAEYGVRAPDNVTLLVGTQVDHAGAG